MRNTEQHFEKLSAVVQYRLFRNAKRAAEHETVRFPKMRHWRPHINWMCARAHFGQIPMNVICDIALRTHRARKGLAH